MDLDLARMYDTPGRSVAEAEQATELAKQASIELFAKVAAEQGIDLNQLSDEQVASLWETTFATKIAEFPPQFAANMKGKGDKDGDDKGEKKDEKHDEKKDDKEKKAAAELSELQDEHVKLAFADKMGKTMAHSFVKELDSIQEARTKEAAAKAAGTPTGTPKVAAEALPTIKMASAFEQLAVDKAIKLATDAQVDATEVTRKLAARNELGFTASTKVASAPAGNLQAALEIRALEMLEQAGYPVKWEG